MIKPEWLRKPHVPFDSVVPLRKQLSGSGLNTVCRSARCPNMGECFSAGVAAFMILGDNCSRSCRFCAVEADGKNLAPPDPDEPNRLAKTAVSMRLDHVVITSVTRDDLPDGGASHFACVINALRRNLPLAAVEVLIPDFKGDADAIDKVINAKPDVFNHNIESIPRLYPTVRPQADYRQSLRVLERAKIVDKKILTKSGLLLGLGETFDEVVDVMKDLRQVDCDIVTIGQYLQPTLEQIEVSEYVRQEVFVELEKVGERIGFAQVFSGPFVRSSYHAGEVFRIAATP